MLNLVTHNKQTFVRQGSFNTPPKGAVIIPQSDWERVIMGPLSH